MSIKVFEDWPRPCAVSHLAGMLQKYAQADMHALKHLATLKHWLRFMSSLTYVYISLMDIIISKCITWRNLIYFFSLVQLAWKSARQVSVPMPGSRDVSALFELMEVWESCGTAPWWGCFWALWTSMKSFEFIWNVTIKGFWNFISWALFFFFLIQKLSFPITSFPDKFVLKFFAVS